MLPECWLQISKNKESNKICLFCIEKVLITSFRVVYTMFKRYITQQSKIYISRFSFFVYQSHLVETFPITYGIPFPLSSAYFTRNFHDRSNLCAKRQNVKYTIPYLLFFFFFIQGISSRASVTQYKINRVVAVQAHRKKTSDWSGGRVCTVRIINYIYWHAKRKTKKS
jgi:hypothetical protein